jgi:dTDP-4-amino-4,6-dideoxygalactose transaminase
MTMNDSVRAAGPPIPLTRPWFGDDELLGLTETLLSGWVAQGPRVAAFEAAFAERVGAVDAVAVSSCTAALHLALVLLGVGPGDEVVVPSFSFVATTSAVVYVGATPVFADVDAVTGNLTPDTIAPVIGPRTRAVIVVHQAGVPADVGAIRALCDPRGIPLVEDAACAIGSRLHGALIGSHSEVVAFSFHPRKILTTGEGGMLAVSDATLASHARRLREHGMSISAADRHRSGGVRIEQYLETGFNYRMTDLQAAVGLVQLRRLDAMVTRRRALAAAYHSGIDGIAGLRAVNDPPHGTTNYQSFWVLLGDVPVSRNELMELFAARGITTRRGIMAAHLEPSCERWATRPLPVTEHLTQRSIVLPLFHDMTPAEQERVIEVLWDVCS